MTQDRVMLLIDADNVSIDIMEQAVQLLHKQHGGVHVRRAYCTAESAVKHQAAFKRLGIKPMVNLAAGKNSTDIAMAVDAIDLVLSERPDVVVIASSDSDFAPLVQRLREKGCEVRGIGQLGKTGQETQEVYDDFTVLEHRKSVEAPAAKRPAARKVAPAAKRAAVAAKAPAARKAPAAKKGARKSVAKTAANTAANDAENTAANAASTRSADAAAKSSTAPVPPVDDDALEAQVAAAFADAVASDEADVVDAAPPPKPARKRAAREPRKSVDERVAASTAAAQATAADAPEPAAEPAPKPSAPTTAAADKAPRGSAGRASLDAVLQCLPELQSGQSLALNTAVERLRNAQLLGKNSSSLKLFSSWPERFELVPQNRPSVVRLRGT